ncbi:hypothetical protein OSH08_16585 [Kaistia geumhonensis]|uniref:Uncharacterized protein n=1 Tax=Kaistia geumhonensis TaxID=410839 RepID=A0ABU0M9N4_9HYPH|nr:hypothetical protein [Kaistia geumhonensis]MCX5480621.1 hypothetical protein [Kaistia geumhonensis]MDQ0517676.1 hypothetical protein [Kaistia geumhonensis]
MSSEPNSTLQPPDELNSRNLEAAFEKDYPRPIKIDISFFSYKNRKSTLLIGNVLPENNMKARRAWLDFDFNEVIYVTEIRIFATEYEPYHRMELSYVPYLDNDNEVKLTETFLDGSFTFKINDFTKGFGLRPTEPLIRSAELLKIDVRGVERHLISDIVRFVDNIDFEKNSALAQFSSYQEKAKVAYDQVQEHQRQLDRIDQHIESSKNSLLELEEKIESASFSYKKSQEEIEVAKTVINEQSARLENLTQSIDKTSQERRILTEQIVDAERQLSELKSNINLFPTDLNGYVRQGARNVRLYAALAVIPLLVIVGVTLRLFSNSERLLDTVSQLQGISIFDFLLSRAPYVSVSITILGICYAMIKYILYEIIAINRRRQELYKISIISQDVSYASQDDLDLTTEEKYDLRTQTKMELLKEHLRQNVGDEYIYAPRRTFLEHLRKFPRKAGDAVQPDNVQ